MFIGSFKYSIDTKGRFSIPAKHRKYVNPEADNTFYMTRGIVKCIDVYPKDIWLKEVGDYLQKINPFDEHSTFFLRSYLDTASEDSLDSQGRLLIPKNLLTFAEIEREVLVLGAYKKIEVWNPKVYEEYRKEKDIPYAEIAKEVMGRR